MGQVHGEVLLQVSISGLMLTTAHTGQMARYRGDNPRRHLHSFHRVLHLPVW